MHGLPLPPVPIRIGYRLYKFAAIIVLFVLSIIWIVWPRQPIAALGQLPPQTSAQLAPNSEDIFRLQRSPNRMEARREDYSMWELPKGFESDCFTFVRIQYNSGYGGGRRGGQGWRNDYPDCDWNFSLRLQQLTSMQVDPNGKVLTLTDEAIYDYPFVYFSNVQNMRLEASEAIALRRYLLNGGFMMADDFWTPAAWRHVQSEMRKVFPDREPRELTIDHDIFHAVYNFTELPRVPSILAWQQGDMFEYWHGDPEGDEDPHFQAYFDDSGNVMALFCHNNDIGDGWEREGQNHEYFEQFSVKYSYPLGINIVTYALTH